jgi:hypothetical protein
VRLEFGIESLFISSDHGRSTPDKDLKIQQEGLKEIGSGFGVDVLPIGDIYMYNTGKEDFRS